MIIIKQKLELFGFNNLSRLLCISIYDVCYTENTDSQKSYITHMNTRHSSEYLVKVLTNVVDIIDATILNISKYDYEPHGASATLLISEEVSSNQERDVILAHLDKSHLAVHTYPDCHPSKCMASFRIDIDISTCGVIIPLTALNYLIKCFKSDIISLTYNVRGYTRSTCGEKLYNDYELTSLQDSIDEKILKNYNAIDMNLCQANIFHTKMIKKEIDLVNHIFDFNIEALSSSDRVRITENLRKEMSEIYHGSKA